MGWLVAVERRWRRWWWLLMMAMAGWLASWLAAVLVGLSAGFFGLSRRPKLFVDWVLVSSRLAAGGQVHSDAKQRR